jgi:hypothetical protein
MSGGFLVDFIGSTQPPPPAHLRAEAAANGAVAKPAVLYEIKYRLL